MKAPRYRGLTWDHPRGYNALAAASVEVAPLHGVDIAWDKQPLEGFESRPIAEICALYDLVVLDHPHIGEAVAVDCLTPLEDLLEPAALQAIAADTIGPCLASYRYAGRHWALPLDAATQVQALRPDLMDGVPRTWAEVERLPSDVGLALSIAGPHAILTLFSIATAFGAPPASADPQLLFEPDAGTYAYDLLRRLYARADAALLSANPIGILEHLARMDDIALCPLVYGYVNYARADAGRKAIVFAEAPRVDRVGRPGSTLGGTGIGISRRAAVTPELARHLLWLVSEDAQRGFIPEHQGQPSRRSAWTDPRVNAVWGGFYETTSTSVEAAYVRPRHRGYISFQQRASDYLRGALAGDLGAAEVIETLNQTFRQSRGDQQL